MSKHVPKDVYLVCVPRVPGVSRARMTSFIQEAVRCWGGQLHPDDGTPDGDPLGPPCVLGQRGAVKVFPERRWP